MYGEFSWNKIGNGRAEATIEGFTSYDIRKTAKGWGVTSTHGTNQSSDFYPTLRAAILALRARADNAAESHKSAVR